MGIGKVTTECRVIMADLMRTFSTREREPMIKLFNLYIKSKLEYCCVIWSPSADNENQNGINMIEKIQQAFTKKIEGLENLDYHQRLKECNLYSMERRRERYMIIYTWQMLEGKKNRCARTTDKTRYDRPSQKYTTE